MTRLSSSDEEIESHLGNYAELLIASNVHFVSAFITITSYNHLYNQLAFALTKICTGSIRYVMLLDYFLLDIINAATAIHIDTIVKVTTA